MPRDEATSGAVEQIDATISQAAAILREAQTFFHSASVYDHETYEAGETDDW